MERDYRQFNTALIAAIAAVLIVFVSLMYFLPRPQPRYFNVPRSMFKSDKAWEENKQAIRDAVDRGEL